MQIGKKNVNEVRENKAYLKRQKKNYEIGRDKNSLGTRRGKLAS